MLAGMATTMACGNCDGQGTMPDGKTCQACGGSASYTVPEPVVGGDGLGGAGLGGSPGMGAPDIGGD
jgi:hypothetical protein